jgi:hypothetical protein
MVVIGREKIFTSFWIDALVTLCGMFFVVAYVRGYRDAGRHAST